MNGLEAAQEISRIAPATAMILFTVHASPQLVREARSYGIRSVVSKCDMIGENLLSALRQVLAPEASSPE
jgi:DNA-binding NarL/FixJ family response regulator